MLLNIDNLKVLNLSSNLSKMKLFDNLEKTYPNVFSPLLVLEPLSISLSLFLKLYFKFRVLFFTYCSFKSGGELAKLIIL